MDPHNDYGPLFNYRLDHERGERNWRRNEQFVEALREEQLNQPKRPRFSLRLPCLPRWHGFRLWQRSSPLVHRCQESQLGA